MKKTSNTKPVNTAEQKSAAIQRVIAVKKRLPKSGITSLFIQQFPNYKPTRMKNKVTAVLQFRSIDADVIEKLESIADKLSN